MKEMVIDIGARTRDEAMAVAELGEPVYLATTFERYSDHVVKGKAFDDRAGCAAVATVLQEANYPGLTLYGAFTTQEEVGLRGAKVAAYNLNPHMGIALEGTGSANIPGVDPFDTATNMGEGPAISMLDASSVAHPRDSRRVNPPGQGQRHSAPVPAARFRRHRRGRHPFAAGGHSVLYRLDPVPLYPHCGGAAGPAGLPRRLRPDSCLSGQCRERGLPAVKELLTKLTAAWGPSGHEYEVAAVIRTLVTPLVDEVRTDALGNVIALRKSRTGGGKKVMLAAHMDTIGGMVLNIADSGLLYCSPVGGLKAHHGIGHRALFKGGARGIIQHESVDDPRDIDMKKLWVDIGANSRSEAESMVALGDLFTLEAPLVTMGDRIVAPGLDDRAGCAVLLEVARHLTDTPHDVAFVFTVQGEIDNGPRGAGVAAFGLEPEVAFAVDVSPAGDTPKAPKLETKLGGGPALKLKDGQYVAHEGVKSLLLRVAGEFAIPLQREVLPAGKGHSDARIISTAGQGVPTGVITIPARYSGTAGEMVSLRDMHGAADLLLKVLSAPIVAEV